MGSKLLSLGAAILGTVAAMFSGFAWASGDKTRIILPLAALGAIVFGVLALTRFAAFVYLVIGMRASIDLFKLSGSSAGNTVTNNAAARSLDPSSIVGVLFLLAAAVWLIARYHDQGHLRGSRLRLLWVTFWAAGVVSVVGSSIPLTSAMETLRIGTVVMMFVVLEQIIVDRESMMRVLTAVYVSTLFPLLYTFYGFATGHPSAEVKGGFTRITGPFSQSTTYGRYLAFMIIFGVAVYPYLKGRVTDRDGCDRGHLIGLPPAHPDPRRIGRRHCGPRRGHDRAEEQDPARGLRTRPRARSDPGAGPVDQAH